jgi:ketosteroid isomerase-like protein
MRRAAIASVFLIGLISRAESEDLQVAQALNDSLAAAFNGGDSVSIAHLYAEDAILMPPGAKMINGRDGVERYWRTASRSIADTKLTALDVRSASDTEADEVGSFTAKTTGAHPHSIVGKFVILWRKVEGEWKVAVDIWNANN